MLTSPPLSRNVSSFFGAGDLEQVIAGEGPLFGLLLARRWGWRIHRLNRAHIDLFRTFLRAVRER